MKLCAHLIFVTLALMMVGCATGYQSRGFSGGFEEMKLGDNLYRVSFSANGFTDSEQADQFLLRRCAEIALEEGFRYFSYSQESGLWRATVKLLASKEDDRVPFDALTVVSETDAAANGQLSAKAKAALDKLRSGQPISGSPSSPDRTQ